MDLPVNRFKQALREGRQQIGLWCSLASAYTAEIVAESGFDWLLLDTEHSPADVLTVLAQLRALSGHEVSPVVRPASNDTVLIKRYLDLGAQTLLIPYVQTAEEAALAVAGMRYALRGIRGVAGVTRASRFGRVRDYFHVAERELCLLVQIETQAGLDNLEAIAAVDGVDGVFIGPADLSASLGHIGEFGHRKVTDAIDDALARLKALNMPSGILTTDEAYAKHAMERGTIFTAVGIDLNILAQETERLARRFGR